MSHPKDTGKEGLTELPKFRSEKFLPKRGSNPAGNVRSPFQANSLTHSATAPPLLVVFGAVSVAPHSGGHVLVYVRVASPLAQARQHNHNDMLVSRSRRADDVPGTWDNARTAPRMSVRHNRTSVFVSHLVHTRLTWSLVTKNPLSWHSLLVHRFVLKLKLMLSYFLL